MKDGSMKSKVSTLSVLIVFLLWWSLLSAAERKEDPGSSVSEFTAVQSTALLVVFWRHLETQRNVTESPALIHDSPAAILIDKLGTNEYVSKWLLSPVLPIGINLMAIRTRVVDEWLLHSPGANEQIVNLGAGLCTRPYRLSFPENTIIFEVENNAAILTVKRHALLGHPTFARVADVIADVTRPHELEVALLKAGLNPALPIDWVTEGLLEYLSFTDQQSLLRTAAKLSTHGSRFLAFNVDPWGVEYNYKFLGVNFPHIGPVPEKTMIDSMRGAGWSKNVTVLNDDFFWHSYHRAVNLPVYIIMAELADIDRSGTPEL
jgi:methyltransferase (TIGR00027 family)